MFMTYNGLEDWTKGREFERTLLGAMMTYSPIPEVNKPNTLFENPSTTPLQEHDITEKNTWVVGAMSVVKYPVPDSAFEVNSLHFKPILSELLMVNPYFIRFHSNLGVYLGLFLLRCKFKIITYIDFVCRYT